MWGGIDAMVRHRESDILHPDLLASTESPYEVVKRHMVDDLSTDADYFQRMSSFDLRFRLPEQLLARIDRMSMAASVEARVPFLDHRVVEQSLRTDQKVLGNLENQKVLLKNIAGKYLPEHILNRPKDGFSIPLEDVMGSNMDFIRSLQGEGMIASFDEKHFGQILSVRERWALYALNLWMQHSPTTH